MIFRAIKEKVYERKLKGSAVPEVFRSSFAAVKELKTDALIKEASFVVIDTETTGLKPEKGDELLSIAGLGFRNGRIDLSRSFYELIKPQKEVPRQSVIIHHLTPDKFEDLPNVSDVLIRFFQFCGGDILVGHHTAFDARFISHALKEHFGITMANWVVDTGAIARAIQKMDDPVRFSMEGARNVGLDELAYNFQITMPDRHDAYGDAFATALIFQRQIGILEKRGIKTLKDLVHIGGVG